MQDSEFLQFEKEWTKLGIAICQAIYTDPRSQELKAALRQKGYLSLDEKSQFLDICDSVKYRVIYQTHGEPESEGYKKFSQAWESWFQNKGIGSKDLRGQKNSVDHILFGSTPDPEIFLLNFEHEILGSMKA